MRILPIVEGHGEVSSVPLLLRRIAEAGGYVATVQCLSPIRVPRDRLKKPHEMERVVELAARRLGNEDLVLVIVDADDDCPKTLGQDLLARAMAARPDRQISVVVANREYEAWLLASAASLRGHRGLRADLTPPADPESIRDAKGWLSRHMTPPDSVYSETIDQPALTAVFDMTAARNCPSFDKLWRDVTAALAPLVN